MVLPGSHGAHPDGFGTLPALPPPTEETWQIGDREVVCSVYLEGEKLEGSVDGSDRSPNNEERNGILGRILIGVVIGVILVIWLMVSCVQMIF